MTRRHLAGAIVLGWLVAIGWLVQRHYWRPPSAVLAEAALRVPPGATYFAVDVGGRQIGFAASQLDTLRDTIRVQDLAVIQIPAAQRTLRMESRTVTSLSRELELRGFETTLRGDDSRFVARGAFSGDSLLTIDLENDEERHTLRVPIRRPLVLPALLPLHVAFVDPAAIGKAYAFTLFDPAVLTVRDVLLTVTAESTMVVPDSASYDSVLARWEPARWDTLHAWRLSGRVDGRETHTWIDELGQLVETGSSSGFGVRRTAFELAFENYQAERRATDTGTQPADETGIAHLSLMAAGVRLPTAELEELRLRVTGVPAGYLDLADRRQRQTHDTLVLRRELGAANPRALSRDSVRLIDRYTEPGPLVQSSDPRIEAQARQIVGRTSNPLRRARLLNAWVYETIDKHHSAGIVPAVAVLQLRRGDSEDHALLYVALARALGMPARVVGGLVYAQDRFYHHTWPEVWVNGWVAIDPTLGQFPADARHVRLTTEGLLGARDLITSIGTMRLDILSTDGTS